MVETKTNKKIPPTRQTAKAENTPRGLTKTQNCKSKRPPQKVRQSRQSTRTREQSAEGIQMVETKNDTRRFTNPTKSKSRGHTKKGPTKPTKHPNPRAKCRGDSNGRNKKRHKKIPPTRQTAKTEDTPRGLKKPQSCKSKGPPQKVRQSRQNTRTREQSTEGARQNIARRPVLRDRPPRLSFPETYSSTSSRRR